MAARSPHPKSFSSSSSTKNSTPNSASSVRETVQLGPNLTVPRLFIGLWQLSSPAWGTASNAKIRNDMRHHYEQGFRAFDMADHYGSAENLYGRLRSSLSHNEQAKFIGATKWCVFRDINPTRQVVESAVRASLDRMQSQKIDLLQFHWQDYSDHRYIDAAFHLLDLKNEGLITAIGLCNFDTAHTNEICSRLGPGSIATNQVQFSLIDHRPLYGMGEVCLRHGVKLLTYGSLCGGFLSDSWLSQPPPNEYDPDMAMTPSQRKYLDMIIKAWGTWELFQTLLSVLRRIGDRHGGVSIANVATRWVLDHSFVGAVLIGARLGISEHIQDNHRVFSFTLTEQDRADIDRVLDQSNGRNLISTIGDCGAEYRMPEEGAR